MPKFKTEDFTGKTPEEIAALVNPEVETLETNYSTEKQKRIAAESDAKFQKEEATKAFAKRDELKTKIAALEDGKLDEHTKTELESLRTQLAETNTTISNLSNEVTTFKTLSEQQKQSEQQRIQADADAIINGLPEKYQAVAKGIAGQAATEASLTLLKQYAEQVKNPHINTDDGGGKSYPATHFTGKGWNDLDIAERGELRKQNPALYNKLYAERNNPKKN